MLDTPKGHTAVHAVQDPIPGYIEHPGARNHPWNEIPLGICFNGEEISWDVTTSPNALMAGNTGTGKTTVARSVLRHIEAHADQWSVVAIDASRRGFAPEGGSVKSTVAHTVQEGVVALRAVHHEMERRAEAVAHADVATFEDLEEQPKALMVVLEEAYFFLSPHAVEDEKERILQEEALSIITDIAQRGISYGIFLLISTQKPTTDVVPGDLQEHIAFRIATGRTDSMTSYLLLNSSTATVLPDHVGRGWVQYGDKGKPVQFYDAPKR